MFSDRPFKRGEDYATAITDTVRIMEDFLKVPFPTTDIILILQESCGVHYGSHMCLAGVGSVPHETAHYYFRRGPEWIDEGGAEFMADLVADRLGARDFAKSTTEAAGSTRQCTRSTGFENIRHLAYVYDNPWERHIPGIRGCFYPMGRSFLLTVLDTVGEEATSSALRQYFLERSASPQEHEETIYRSFLGHAPMSAKENFKELYRTLHGGHFAFPDIPASDDHGNEARDATPVIVGEAVEGELDYMFDFDYFRFQAQAGQRYRMSVTHAKVRATSLGLYRPDRILSMTDEWESRKRTNNGLQIIWRAPESAAYYFAVRNFGGETGTYTLTVALADN